MTRSHLHSWLRKLALLALPIAGTLILPVEPATAAKITITAILLPGNTPVTADVTRKSSGSEAPVDHTDALGKLTFDEKDCSAETTYSADPDPKSAYDYDKEWKVCKVGKPIPFYFYTRRFAVTVEPIISGNIPGSWGGPGDFKTAIAAIKGSLDNGDLGTAAILSTEASVALRKAGKTEQADAFASFATVTGAGAVTAAAPDANVFVTFDPKQNQWALSDAGESALKDYQTSVQKEATGKFDWQTLRPFSTLSDDDLETLKTQALAGFGS